MREEEDGGREEGRKERRGRGEKERVESGACNSGRGGYIQHGAPYVYAEILTGIVTARR